MPQVSKPEDLQEVGSKIRFLRKEKKMSQLELAEAIGVTQNTIYLIETGQSEMKLGKLFSIAEVLDVAVKASDEESSRCDHGNGNQYAYL